MGYVKGIKWNDDLIAKEILNIKDKLEIDCMPSYGQINKIRKSTDLSNKIAKTGGINKWAKKLNLKITKSETRIGKRGEKIIEEILKTKGYDVKNVSEKKFPYDLIVNNDIKIDVKLSHLYKGCNGNFYSCNLEKKIPTCDLYIIICENDDMSINKILIIPSKFLMGTKQLVIGVNSKYDKFDNKFEYIDKFDSFYTSLQEVEDES